MKILVVDDDKNLNSGITTFLKSNNILTVSAFDGEEGYNRITSEEFDLVLSDLEMPKMNGIKLLEKIKEKNLEIPFIIMTAYASVENAVEAMKIGAEDYLTKPINLKEMLIKIEKIIKSMGLLKENKELKKRVANYETPEIVGESEAIKELKSILRKISSDPNIAISIYGKSGTGKELVARNIHYMSERKEKPFVPINCAVLSDDLLESELFGYMKGAFTGAIQNRIGLLESCEGGTIFLDEISEMSPRVQAKLLRVLQDGIIQPVGSNEQKKINVRFISASNQNLSDLVDQNKFRDDLYFRLNIIEIYVPSLEARKSDIPILIKYFLEKYESSNKLFSEEAINRLIKYDWPGNIRELENLIRRLLVTVENKIIHVDDFPQKLLIKNEIPVLQKINYEDE
ncbi:MAG: sigma-54 dependent transcriptional regulator, partial [Melioribacteraceae bacterium]|nr:sigma-54 dependent transcriptional regulator [Melioribacteraceae bacterium]